MKYFLFKIVDDEIKECLGEVDYVPTEFIDCKSTLAFDDVHYKLVDGKITEAIGEAFHESVARRRLEDFFSFLNVSLI